MDEFDASVPLVVRVATPGSPAFQLRKGEEGLSVFDPAGVDPPLTESEILEAFRDGSVILIRLVSVIEATGLCVESIDGGAVCQSGCGRPTVNYGPDLEWADRPSSKH